MRYLVATLLALLAVAAPAGAQAPTPPAGVTVPDGPSSSPVFQLVAQTWQTMTFTEYTHKHYVENTSTGVYDFDCVGAVNWFLSQAAPQAQQAMYQSIGVRPKHVPRPTQMYDYLSSSQSSGSFTQVTTPSAISPGDVLILAGGDTGDGNPYPGHAMIAASNPVKLKKKGSYSVMVYDSTGTPHGKQDSRRWDPRTQPSVPNPSVLHSGLGFGTIAVHAVAGGGMTMSWSVGVKPEPHAFLVSSPST
jgi:hypothetical protein